MYFEGGFYEEIDPYFDQLGEQDIIELDLKYRETIQGGRLPW